MTVPPASELAGIPPAQPAPERTHRGGRVKIAGWARAAAFGLVAAAVCFLPMNGVRLTSSVTLGDAFLVAAGLALAVAIVADPAALRAVPLWLAGAAVGIGLAALLVAAFPPHGGAAEHLTQHSLLTHRTISQAYESSRNLSYAARLIAAMLLVPLIVGLPCTTPRRVRLLAVVWLLGTTASALVAVLANLHVVDLQGTLTGHDYALHYPGEATRYSGLSVHPVHLALTCVLALPIAVLRLGPGRRLAYAPAAAVLALAAAASGSRAGVGAAALVFVIAVLARRREWRTLVALGAVAVIVVAVAVAPHHPLAGVQRIGGSTSASHSNTSRDRHYSATVHDVLARPVVGHGFQTIRGGHDLALELLEAGGLVALAAFALFVAGTLWRGWRLSRAPLRPPDMQAVALAAVVSVCAFLVFTAVSNPVLDRYIYVPVGLLIGVAVAASGARCSKVAIPTPPPG